MNEKVQFLSECENKICKMVDELSSLNYDGSGDFAEDESDDYYELDTAYREAINALEDFIIELKIYREKIQNDIVIEVGEIDA